MKYQEMQLVPENLSKHKAKTKIMRSVPTSLNQCKTKIKMMWLMMMVLNRQTKKLRIMGQQQKITRNETEGNRLESILLSSESKYHADLSAHHEARDKVSEFGMRAHCKTCN